MMVCENGGRGWNVSEKWKKEHFLNVSGHKRDDRSEWWVSIGTIRHRDGLMEVTCYE